MKKLFVLAILFFTGFAAISYAGIDKIYEAAVINFKGDVKVDMNADGNRVSAYTGMKLRKDEDQEKEVSPSQGSVDSGDLNGGNERV